MDVNKLKENFRSGYIPSPKDERNFKISKLVAPINVFPNEFSLDISKLEIQDQGYVGCCVAETLCYIKHIIEREQSKTTKLFSTGFIYGNRSEKDTKEEGMIPHQALKHLVDEGCVLEEDFPTICEVPEIIEKVNQVKASLLPKAKPFRISAYAELNTIEDMKNAIFQLKSPVLIGIPVYLNFLFTDATGMTKMPTQFDIDNDRYIGLHALTVVGWTKDNRWIVVNSWGKEWAKDGICYLPFEFPMCEVWSVTDNIVPEPTPEPTKKWWRVQCGAFKLKDGAVKMQATLKSKGYSNSYIVFVDGYYKVQLGAFSIEENCRKLSRELTSKGISNFIRFY